MSHKWIVRNPEHPDQILQMRANQVPFAYSDSFATFGAGGWGSRKSFAGLGFIDESAWINPGCSGFVMLPTYKLLREYIGNYIRKAFKDIIIGESKQDEAIYLPGGRRIIYGSGHHPERIELYTLAWAYIDEVGLMDASIFYRMVARIRDKRAKFPRIGATGVPYWGWLKKEFDGRNDKQRRILRLRTVDNTDLHPDTVRNLLDACPARMQGCFLEGEFTSPGGSVYPEFDEAKHVVSWEYDRNLETGCCIDWAPRVPGVLYVQLLPKNYQLTPAIKLPNGGAIIFDELHLDGSTFAVTTENLVNHIKAKGYRLDFAIVDPSGESVEATSGKTEISIAKRMMPGTGFLYKTKSDLRRIPVGINHVKRMLEPIKGPPLLYFAVSIASAHQPRHVVPAIRAYSYPKDKDDKPLDEIPIKDGITDHAMDLLRYLAINKFPVHRLQPKFRSLA